MGRTQAMRPRVLLVNRCLVEKDGKILIIQRAANDSYEANKWEIPGGKLEIGDDPSYSIETEVLEECNLYVKITSPKYFVETKVAREGKYEGLPIVNIVGEAKVIGGQIKLSHEHQDYRWIKPEELKNYSATEITKKAIAALLD